MEEYFQAKISRKSAWYTVKPHKLEPTFLGVSLNRFLYKWYLTKF